MVIAIDGPAGSGKSTVARLLARRLEWTYLDSGAMYRCVALEALRRRVPLDDADRLGKLAGSLRIELKGDGDGPVGVLVDARDVTNEIREPDVSAAASEVAVHRPVREALVDQQRRMIAAGRYVAEGRDIGTIVSPESPLKVFLTADVEERARRRAAESGVPFEQERVAQKERDRRDTERSLGALRKAEDAVEVDTTGLEIDTVVERIATLAAERHLV